MDLFSDRQRIGPRRMEPQVTSFDKRLRNALWTAFVKDVWTPRDTWCHDDITRRDRVVEHIWLQLFGRSIDDVPQTDKDGRGPARDVLRKYFENCTWWKLLDLLELAIRGLSPARSAALAKALNDAMVAHYAAYRVIAGRFVPITDPHEMRAVDEAASSGGQPARKHIEKALKFLSDRDSPDYCNSIKDAICALEATCREIAGDQSAGLSDALKRMKSEPQVHPALVGAMDKLYGFASDAGGVRHASREPQNTPSFEDAKLVLVLCCAIINFLLAAQAKRGS
ncbi:MAG TPA: hypothetical protein VLH79_15635 [Chthonomonadales bacterium]|nr:hypothetical protein [Chthonomonadales bacterium]